VVASAALACRRSGRPVEILCSRYSYLESRRAIVWWYHRLWRIILDSMPLRCDEFKVDTSLASGGLPAALVGIRTGIPLKGHSQRHRISMIHVVVPTALIYRMRTLTLEKHRYQDRYPTGICAGIISVRRRSDGVVRRDGALSRAIPTFTCQKDE
jgi:hypothetical protein